MSISERLIQITEERRQIESLSPVLRTEWESLLREHGILFQESRQKLKYFAFALLKFLGTIDDENPSEICFTRTIEREMETADGKTLKASVWCFGDDPAQSRKIIIEQEGLDCKLVLCKNYALIIGLQHKFKIKKGFTPIQRRPATLEELTQFKTNVLDPLKAKLLTG